MIRYIKLFLFTFLFTLFGFGFTHGLGAYQFVGLTGSTSALDDDYSITFLKGGGLLTNFLGTSKGVLALRNNVIFWWTPNGLPYVYMKANYGKVTQGFFDRYYSCDEITNYVLTGCSLAGYLSGSLDQVTYDVITNFFKQVNINDVAYYDYSNYSYAGATYDYDYNKITVCWSSESIGKSLCFNGGYCSDLSNSNCKFFGNNLGSLVNSQNYSDLLFSSIPLNSIGQAPGQVGFGQGVSDAPSEIIEQEVTNTDVVDYYEWNYGFDRSMCYVGIDDLTTEYGSLWTTSGQSSLFDMFTSLYNRLPASNGYEIIGRWIDFWLFNYDQWFNTNQNPKFLLVGSPLAEQWSKIYSGFTSPFQGNPAFIYYYFSDLSLDFYGQIGTKRFGPLLAQYCDLKINGTNQYDILTGSKQVIIDEKNSQIGYTDGEYQNPTQGYNGGTSGFWDNNSYTGVQTVNGSFSQFYSNLTSLLSGIDVKGNGIIPNYILFFLSFILLVRVLKK